MQSMNRNYKDLVIFSQGKVFVFIKKPKRGEKLSLQQDQFAFLHVIVVTAVIVSNQRLNKITL